VEGASSLESSDVDASHVEKVLAAARKIWLVQVALVVATGGASGHVNLARVRLNRPARGPALRGGPWVTSDERRWPQLAGAASNRARHPGLTSQQWRLSVAEDGFESLAVQAYGEGLEEGRSGQNGRKPRARKLSDRMGCS